MTLESSIKTALSPIVAIGGPAAPRISLHTLAKAVTLPAVTYFRVDTGFEYAHDGDSTLIHPRYQISCWAATPVAATALARSVQLALNAWAGGAALPQDQRSLSDPASGVFQEVLDYVFWWNVP